MTRTRALAALALVLFSTGSVHAGGPMVLGGPKKGNEGQPFVWDNSRPISYRTDRGTLGGWSNDVANARVQSMFQVWQNVATASLSFQRVGAITGIADGDVSTAAELNTAMASCDSGQQTPIVYDTDGSIFTELGYDSSVVGFAGSCSLSDTGYIVTGFAMMNGAWAGDSDFDAAFIHEFGHLIGLDHSYVPCNNGCYPDDNQALPTMFPVLVSAEMRTLAPDDISWVSRLYPASGFSGSYGMVRGKILFSDGITPVQGAIVVVRQVDNPATPPDESRTIAISGVSGYRFTGNPGQSYTADYLPCSPADQCPHGFMDNNVDGDVFGSRDPALRGLYEISVPPGQYTIEVRTLNTGYGEDTIGPLQPPIQLPGPWEVWNLNESATDPAGDSVVPAPDSITVTAGGSAENIDIILNGTAPRFDQFEQSDAPTQGSQLTALRRTIRAFDLFVRAPRGGHR